MVLYVTLITNKSGKKHVHPNSPHTIYDQIINYLKNYTDHKLVSDVLTQLRPALGDIAPFGNDV